MPESAPVPMHESGPATDLIVDELRGSDHKVPYFLSIYFICYSTSYTFYHYVPIFNDFLFLLQNDDASVPSEKVADKAVSGTGCSDGVDPTEP